jgi:oligosaccharide reducing-end xylanase
MAYLSDIKNHDVRTEGMSYGLMVAVQFDRQDIFNRVWAWATKYMQHKSGSYQGYFAWSCSTSGTQNSQGPASDGELYFITALVLASNKWGNTGKVNYLKEAQNILSASWGKTGAGGVYPFIDKSNHLITFTADTFCRGYTDPSYHIPSFYTVWQKWGGDTHADFYADCATAARSYLHKAVNSQTGLAPDQTNFDGSARGGSAFRFDAWRVPMNIALDYSWACADLTWQQSYAEKIQNCFYSKGIDKYVDQYNIDGSATSPMAAGGVARLRHSVGLVGTLGAASLMVKHDKGVEFVDAVWKSKNERYSDGYFDAYYDGLLRLFSFMHLSGAYQAIAPK